MDAEHKNTDKKIKRLSNRLAKEYKQAEKELKQKANDYLKKFAEKDSAKRALVDSGKMTQKQYAEWRAQEILYKDAWSQKVDVMASYFASVDKQAADIINGELAGVYASNYNFSAYQIESKVGAKASFTLHDKKSVERLARDNPRLLPKVDPDKVKAAKWSNRKINSAITQGILQGEAIPDIAKRLESVVGMGWNSAVRNARTAMTGAQNAGRIDSYHDAQEMGIKLKKQWVATLDERTRESHADMDGEVVDVDEPFSNDLMYPADADGDDPAEIYNCRCTMIADIDDSEETEESDQTYEEWMEEKISRRV